MGVPSRPSAIGNKNAESWGCKQGVLFIEIEKLNPYHGDNLEQTDDIGPFQGLLMVFRHEAVEDEEKC